MTSEDELFQLFYAYMDAYFLERNEEKTLAMFHSSLTGFGTGRDENANEVGVFEALYHRDFEQAPDPIEVTYLFAKAVPLTPETGLVFAQINICGDIMGQPFVMKGLRISTVFIKDGPTWQLAHMHISLPTGIHDPGESYPLKEIDERNRLLETMVAEKTRELQLKNLELEHALLQIRTLRGLLPICANCKKIRDDTGYWNQVEEYICRHADVQFSHSICPDCLRKLYPDIAVEILDQGNSKP